MARGRHSDMRPPLDGIPCPHCGHGFSAVVDSRPTGGMIGSPLGMSQKAKRRRRLCLGCGKKFSTIEQCVANNSTPLITARHVRLGLSGLTPIDQRSILVELLARMVGVTVRIVEPGGEEDVGDGVAPAKAPFSDGEAASV